MARHTDKYGNVKVAGQKPRGSKMAFDEYVESYSLVRQNHQHKFYEPSNVPEKRMTRLTTNIVAHET